MVEDYWGINDESRQHDFKTYIFTNFNHIDLFRDNDHSWRTYNSGGGFQGGAMIASGIILSILVYGLGNSPLELSHTYIEVLESVGALGFVIFGLIGLFVGGFYLYNVGTDVLNIVPAAIQNVFHYPDVTNAGIIPYLNIFVGLKVFVGLSSIVIAFAGFKKIVEESE